MEHVESARNQELSPDTAQFLAALKRDLTAGCVELPGFPDISLHVQQLLADDNVATDKVLRLVGAEPVLAARIMQLANSAALNPTGTPITELRTAVARMGFDSLRAAAVSFAMAQLRVSAAYKSIEKPLLVLWQDSVLMAATACAVARRCRRISSDTALFAGLVSGVGKICLLARASRVPALAGDSVAFRVIVRDWHAEIAKALLSSWNVADDIIEAVHAYEQHLDLARGQSPLTDVLTVAELLSLYPQMPEQMGEALRRARAPARIGLGADQCVALLAESQAEVSALQQALYQ